MLRRDIRLSAKASRAIPDRRLDLYRFTIRVTRCLSAERSMFGRSETIRGSPAGSADPARRKERVVDASSTRLDVRRLEHRGTRHKLFLVPLASGSLDARNSSLADSSSPFLPRSSDSLEAFGR